MVSQELIDGYRQEINGIDQEIVQNVVRRMSVVTTIIEESRRCEITHKLGETVDTAVYVGAPNPNSLFSIDSGSVFKKLDELIDTTKKGDDCQRQSYIDKMRTAAVRLHSSLAQINEIFEIHRRLDQAGININADKKFGVVIDHSKEFLLPEGMTTCVKYSVVDDGSVKYVLCSDKEATVSMDGDGKFYVLAEVTKDVIGHFFHETENVAVELSDIVQTIENYGLDETHIKKSNDCLDVANENTVKNIVEAFDKMTDDVKTYAMCLVSYIDRVLKMNNKT